MKICLHQDGKVELVPQSRQDTAFLASLVSVLTETGVAIIKPKMYENIGFNFSAPAVIPREQVTLYHQFMNQVPLVTKESEDESAAD